ncbi:MAG: hypothetical protein H0T50_11445 [Gemmatimonadales bacterium]|nr:hypothetical protein [Gemmatimonadales bacterium]
MMSESGGYVDPDQGAWRGAAKIVPRVIGHARVLSEHAEYQQSVRRDTWCPVVDRNPGTAPPEAYSGYGWLDLGNWLVHVWALHLEVEPRS